MDLRRCVYILKEFNRYRRGEYQTFKDFELITLSSVTEIGEAIEFAINFIEVNNNET